MIYSETRKWECIIKFIEGLEMHQKKANEKGEPLKVSIFVGGPPSHTFAAVMPLA